MMLQALALVALGALLQDPDTGPAGFRALSFESALEAARGESRCVVIDFYVAGSPEAKLADEVLWRDAIVRRWLAERVVAIRAEITPASALVARYSAAEGAIVFVDASGDEIERLRAVTGPDAFMQVGREILRCAPAVAAARKALLAAPDSPRAHLDLGGVYFSFRRFDKCLEQYLWAWDHGTADASFGEYRRDTLPRQLTNVIHALPSARREVATRRDALRTRLFLFTEGDPHVALAFDLGALNTALEAHERQLDDFRTLRDRPGVPPAVVQALFTDGCANLLLQQRQFAELLAVRGDVLAQIEKRYAGLAQDRTAALARPLDDPDREQLLMRLDARRNMLLVTTSTYVDALCTVGKLDDARGIVQLALAHDARAQAYASLVAAAARGGRLEVAREIADAGLAALTDPAERARLDKAIGAAFPAEK